MRKVKPKAMTPSISKKARSTTPVTFTSMINNMAPTKKKDAKISIVDDLYELDFKKSNYCKGIIAKHFKMNPLEMAEFYETHKRMIAKTDRAKEWKKKRKKGIFNEKDIGSKKITEDMNKISHIYFKNKVQYLQIVRDKEKEDK